jgi:FkbM family methyltransferase
MRKNKLSRGQKLCKECDTINAARQRICKGCGAKFVSKKTPISFVQIGASAGGDEVFDFFKNKHVGFGLLVEPNPNLTDRLLKSYESIDNVVLEECAIVPHEDIKNVRMHWTDKHIGVGSVFKEHVHKHGYTDDDIEIFDAPAMTINSLFEKYNISKLDHLFIDTEGLDADIILSLDLDKYDIKTISYEHFHIRTREPAVITKLWQHGYSIGKARKYDRTAYKIENEFAW